MNVSSNIHCGGKGATLIESMLAVLVLAVAIPLVFGTLAESGKTGMSAEAETRASWIIPACMNEIRASRDGKPDYFAATVAGQAFPPSGEVWALGFSEDGRTVGKISKSIYDKGTKEIDGRNVRYIATLAAAKQTDSPLLRIDIVLEYPSSAPVAKRVKLDFHSRIP